MNQIVCLRHRPQFQLRQHHQPEIPHQHPFKRRCLLINSNSSSSSRHRIKISSSFTHASEKSKQVVSHQRRAQPTSKIQTQKTARKPKAFIHTSSPSPTAIRCLSICASKSSSVIVIFTLSSRDLWRESRIIWWVDELICYMARAAPNRTSSFHLCCRSKWKSSSSSRRRSEINWNYVTSSRKRRWCCRKSRRFYVFTAKLHRWWPINLSPSRWAPFWKTKKSTVWLHQSRRRNIVIRIVRDLMDASSFKRWRTWMTNMIKLRWDEHCCRSEDEFYTCNLWQDLVNLSLVAFSNSTNFSRPFPLIQEAMIIRHTNEAESLNAVQKMDWGWRMKEFSLCEYRANPEIEELFVPMIDVSDEVYCATRETF